MPFRVPTGGLLFLSTLSLRRATNTSPGPKSMTPISIHALLAESDPTRPCKKSRMSKISIHALLAESDPRKLPEISRPKNFYPRSPCGERLTEMRVALDDIKISIHALLAESDFSIRRPALAGRHFYPRSPCGERLQWTARCIISGAFLSTLSLRRATVTMARTRGFSSPFLSTLSLRRATVTGSESQKLILHFYPRSPCGERPWHSEPGRDLGSDFYPRSPCGERRIALHDLIKHFFISIHALLAESDEAEDGYKDTLTISIHALLAESDVGIFGDKPYHENFYPRSPCGERRSADYNCRNARLISIHALLAESDIKL